MAFQNFKRKWLSLCVLSYVSLNSEHDNLILTDRVSVKKI